MLIKIYKNKSVQSGQSCKSFKRGFTLIELLVVIAIIAILMSVLMPAMQRARMLAREAVCSSSMRQIGLAAANYENDYGRLPMHYTENGGRSLPEGNEAPLRSWPDMVANVGGLDTRVLWVPYISDMKFFNCPMVRTLDYNIETAPLNSARIYGGYQFIMGYMRDRSADGQWGQRWTKTSQSWTYRGRRYNVLASDKMYYALSQGHYRINHGANLDLPLLYSDYERSRDTGFMGSLYEKYGVYGDDLREQTNAIYVFTDGSTGKFNGNDERMVEVVTPSDQDSNSGSILMPPY